MFVSKAEEFGFKMQKQDILLVGAPGSGKGTQAVRLVAQKQLSHLSTGDLFRKNLKEKSDLGLLVKGYLDKGQLVPDQVTNDIVKVFVKDTPENKGIVFDGFPRNISQATALETILHESGRQLRKVIYFKVSDGEIIERLTGRLHAPKSGRIYHIKKDPPKKTGVCDVSGEVLVTRADDKEEVIKSRLNIFHRETKPLLDYYKKRQILETMDASLSPDQVFDSILQMLKA